MRVFKIRPAGLLLILALAVAAAIIPDHQVALSASMDKYPARVSVTSDAGTREHITYQKTLIEALDEAGIAVGEHDLLSLDDSLPLDPGQTYAVTLTRMENVTLNWGGFALDTPVDFTDMDDLLSRSGFSSLDLTGDSYLENSADPRLALNFIEVEKVLVTEYETISYSSITVDDRSMYIGTTNVRVEGVNGTRAIYYERTYENGVLVNAVKTGSEVTEEPVQEVIHKGIMPRIAYTKLNWNTAKSNVLSSLSKISGYLDPHGDTSYNAFVDNGDGTITVDGVTFDYDSMKKRTITMYDGLQVCQFAGCHTPAINHPTFSGVPAQRGVVATYGVKIDGKYVGTVLPLGTIIFVEGYGLGVVGDVHGAINNPDMIDAGYDPGETIDGTVTFGKMYSRVYILDVP